MNERRTVICLIATLLACGDDPASSDLLLLDGEWAYTATNLMGGGLSCDVREVTLVMSESGGAVTGSSAGGAIVCRVGGAQADPIPVGPGTITGTIEGASVLFQITQGGNVVQHSGTLSPGRIQGTANSMIDFGEPAGIVVSTGSFSAVRP